MFEKAGGTMQMYYTLGEYGFVSIVEVPRDEPCGDSPLFRQYGEYPNENDEGFDRTRNGESAVRRARIRETSRAAMIHHVTPFSLSNKSILSFEPAVCCYSSTITFV